MYIRGKPSGKCSVEKYENTGAEQGDNVTKQS